MTLIRVKGFKIFLDRHGKKVRCYHRKTGESIDLTKYPLGTAEFFAECGRITAVSNAQKLLEPKAGTLGALMQFYEETDHFRDDLSAVSKKDYRWCRSFLESVKDTPIHIIDTPLISGIHDIASEKRGFRRGNLVKTYLSEVFKYAIPKGLIDENYAKDVINKRRPKSKPRANKPWSLAEITLIFTRAPAHISAPLGIMLGTGLDPTDALELPKSAIQDGVIWDWRNKTGHEQAVPIGPLLRAVLETIAPHDAETVLANSRGQSWKYSGFSSSWHTFKNNLATEGYPVTHLTPKGLRHTLATSLREEGQDERAIADVLGQKTPSMARHYSRNASLAKKNKKTLKSIRKREKALAEVVKPSRKTVKPIAPEGGTI
ncbi:tyrosine-type recombinase/integrase [Sulfitobacter sp.]|uniref:tyrosine-type recombinase/integrase n=1 Tax=Sulfitobacter sp. TaxID=1903071 RepID=UPI00356AC594